jgi:hypothetical protein
VVRLRVVVCAVVVGGVTLVLALCLVSVESGVASGGPIQARPAVASLTSGQRSAVSCTSRGACTAVGSYIERASVQVERWNGVRWEIQRTPKPNGRGEV